MTTNAWTVNKANNIGYTFRLALGSNISENIDFTLSWRGTYNQAWNDIEGVGRSAKNNYFNHSANGNIKWQDYKPLAREEIEKVFGSRLVDSVMEENAKDCALNIKAIDVINNIDKICQIIDNIPQKDKLLAIYEKLGAMKSLSDLGVDEKLKDKLFFYSPSVRNRLTLMRLRQSAKI